MKRSKRRLNRRRSRNHAIYVRYKGKRIKQAAARMRLAHQLRKSGKARTMKSALRKAAARLSRFKAYHGKDRVRILSGRRRKSKHFSPKKFIRMGGHKLSWRGVVKKYGVKKGKKVWRKHKKIGKK